MFRGHLGLLLMHQVTFEWLTCKVPFPFQFHFWSMIHSIEVFEMKSRQPGKNYLNGEVILISEFEISEIRITTKVIWGDPYFWIHGMRNKNQFNIQVFLPGWHATRTWFRKTSIDSFSCMEVQYMYHFLNGKLMWINSAELIRLWSKTFCLLILQGDFICLQVVPYTAVIPIYT